MDKAERQNYRKMLSANICECMDVLAGFDLMNEAEQREVLNIVKGHLSYYHEPMKIGLDYQLATCYCNVVIGWCFAVKYNEHRQQLKQICKYINEALEAVLSILCDAENKKEVAVN